MLEQASHPGAIRACAICASGPLGIRSGAASSVPPASWPEEFVWRLLGDFKEGAYI